MTPLAGLRLPRGLTASLEEALDHDETVVDVAHYDEGSDASITEPGSRQKDPESTESGCSSKLTPPPGLGDNQQGAANKDDKADKGAVNKADKADKGVANKGDKGDKGAANKGDKGDKGAATKGDKGSMKRLNMAAPTFVMPTATAPEASATTATNATATIATASEEPAEQSETDNK